ncbi:hypothetical protein D3C78_1508700 [compost metagenome]
MDMVATPPSSTCFQYLRKTSKSGTFTWAPVFSTALNDGVSWMFRRMYRPTAISRMLARKGTRQPQASSSSLDRVVAISRKTRLASMVPAGTPICTQEP